jgi:predicted nucleotidyltransferase component of viral defense system
MVEQDLLISRALRSMFIEPRLEGKIAVRGGTTINKVVLKYPSRYSEDIDLVHIVNEPIGPTTHAIFSALSWLGNCSSKQGQHSIHLIYKFNPEFDATLTLRLKVEMNTREHNNLLGLASYPFAMSNGWYSGSAEIISFKPEELFGTKLRALLQRRKNRDLFDLFYGLVHLNLDVDKIIACFYHYMALEGKSISRAMAEQRMFEKLATSLIDDINPLLPIGTQFSDDDAIRAFNLVWKELIVRLKGDPWKLTKKFAEELRLQKYPTLLIGII